MRRAWLALPALALLLGAGPKQLDSQAVLQHYGLALLDAAVPRVVVFTYTITQAGPQNIEQRHELYRSGASVRDELIAVDGVALPHKSVRIEQREDRYAVDKIAPRGDAYEMLFVHTVRDGSHLDYVYDTTPVLRPSAGMWIDQVTIDGITFLPRMVKFHSVGETASGTGTIEYAAFGHYWLPTVASATATVAGKPARERIAWSEYRFPPSLPPSTFSAPKPLPVATLPPI